MQHQGQLTLILKINFIDLEYHSTVSPRVSLQPVLTPLTSWPAHKVAVKGAGIPIKSPAARGPSVTEKTLPGDCSGLAPRQEGTGTRALPSCHPKAAQRVRAL